MNWSSYGRRYMKKFFLIFTVIFLWLGKGFASEKIYCIDLDAERYSKYPIYEISDLNKKGNCDADNVAGSYKGRKLVLISKKDLKTWAEFRFTSYVISRNNLEIYLATKNLNAESKYLNTEKPKKQIQTSNQNNKTVSKSKNSDSCYKLSKHTWSISGNYAEFKFTSNSSKTININKIIIETKNLQTVLNETVSLRLKPFGIGSTRVYIGDRNREALHYGNYRCSYASGSKSISPITSSKKDTSGGFKWWYIVVALIAVMFFGGLLENMNKKGSRTKIVKSRNEYSANLISDVWEGKKSLPQTFWLYYFVVNGIISVVSGLLVAGSGSNIFLLIAVVSNIWASVGTWNSATNYQLNKINLKQPYGWAYGAKALVVLNFLTLAGQSILILNS